MGRLNVRRLMALGLVAGVLMALAAGAEAGGNCPPGWNSGAKRTSQNGMVFTWKAGAT